MPYVSIRARPATSDEDWWDSGPLLPSLQAPDTRPVDTGLLDARGYKIMRVAPPIGFGRDEEW